MCKSAVIALILSKKKSTSKRGLDIFGNLYMLHAVVDVLDDGTVAPNNNPFWADDNISNRLDLIDDIEAIPEKSKSDLLDFQFLKILLRYERGDKYGIEPNSAVRFPKKLFRLRIL